MNPRNDQLDAGLQQMMRGRTGKNWYPSPAPVGCYRVDACVLKGDHPGAALEDAWFSCTAGRPGDIIARFCNLDYVEASHQMELQLFL